MRRRARERQEKREDRRPILKRLSAALLWSFRGQQDKKMVCVMGGPEVTGTLGKPIAKAKANSDTTQKMLGTAPPH